MSGLEFKVEFFPVSLCSREAHHPIFDLPLKKLWRFIPKWSAGELNQVDSYLLFLAFLNATDLVRFQTSAKVTEQTNSIVASQMQPLISAIQKISGIKHPVFAVPRFSINEVTSDLSTISALIQSWHEAHAEFLKGSAREKYKSKLQAKEVSLYKLIRSPQLNPKSYAHILASWAALAADFPEYQVKAPDGSITTLSQYWQDLIIRCHTDTEVISLPLADLEELLEHVETTVEVGTIFATHLFSTIRVGISTIKDFHLTPFTIVDSAEQAEVEAANLQNLIASAPEAEPKRTNYPNEFSFIKAKMKWQLAQKYKAAPSSDSSTSTSTSINSQEL